MRRRWAVAGISVAVTLVLAGLVVTGLLPLADPDPASSGRIPQIQHLIVIVQENHAFDNYFGSYCPTVGPYCSTAVDGTPQGTCIPYSLSSPSAGCVTPFPVGPTWQPPSDIAHTWGADHLSWDQGKMDGFVQADLGSTTPMAYYTNSTVGAYWDLAEQYGLGEQFFSGALGASLANHWLLVAGVPPTMSYKDAFPNFVHAGQLTAAGQAYLSEANGTPTLADWLTAAGLSWTVYAGAWPSQGYGTELNLTVHAGTMEGTLFDEFNPFLAKASSYDPSMAKHFSSRYQLPIDFAGGHAPNVSWVFPSFPQSEHPPGFAATGIQWATSVIDAVESSPDWASSAIVLTWDEGGGWYDHVAPPNENATGPGFRIPLLVISPFAREGYVSSSFADTESIARLTEQVFGLPSLGGADASAPSLLPFFDFNASPRGSIEFSANQSYPMPLQAPLSPASLGASRSVVPAAPPGPTVGVPLATTAGAPTWAYLRPEAAFVGFLPNDRSAADRGRRRRVGAVGRGPVAIPSAELRPGRRRRSTRPGSRPLRHRATVPHCRVEVRSSSR